MGIETTHSIAQDQNTREEARSEPCGCRRATEFLAGPVTQYTASRRELLRAALFGSLAVSAIPLMPLEAAANPFKPSVEEQKKLGNQAAQQIMQKYHVVKDENADRFRHVGERLVNALGRNRGPWDYRFYLIDSPEINAFALPGGNMFMFTGLMKRIRSDDALAAVTGHEMTHVRKEHWAKAYAGQQERELGLSVVLGVTHAGNIARLLAGGLEGLYTLKYSRGEEDQADAGGLQNMVDAGYDPHGMLDLFHTLQEATNGKGEGAAFLSDHPLTSERIRRTEQRIQKLSGNH